MKIFAGTTLFLALLSPLAANAGAWEQPWSIMPDYCSVYRGYGNQGIEIDFLDATSKDLGWKYEIILDGIENLHVPDTGTVPAEIKLGNKTYSTPDIDRVVIKARRIPDSDLIVFNVSDPDLAFQKSLLTSGVITLQVHHDKTIFSMGTAESIQQQVQDCKKTKGL